MNQKLNLRRFWNDVTIVESNERYQFLLDKQFVKLPKKTTLEVQNQELAEKIADEWKKAGHEKGGIFTYDDVPLTRIIGTMIEKVSPEKETYVSVLLPYINGDLLCYHAEKPDKLVLEQIAKWLPITKWVEECFGVKLIIHQGIMPITQSDETIEIFKTYLEQLNNEELTFCAISIPLLGSVMLSVAVLEDRISLEEAFEYAYLDEIIQSDIWGKDTEQQEKLNQIEKELRDVYQFLELSRK